MSHTVVVVGGGPAGMMASIVSASKGNTVALHREQAKELVKRHNKVFVKSGQGDFLVRKPGNPPVHVANDPPKGIFGFHVGIQGGNAQKGKKNLQQKPGDHA